MKSCLQFGFLFLALYLGVVAHAAAVTVNVNTASASELASALPGIGPAKAQAIVDHRQTHGPFRSVGQLVDVRGIGPATLAKIRSLVSVGDGLPGNTAPLPQAVAPDSDDEEEAAARSVRDIVNQAKQARIDALN